MTQDYTIYSLGDSAAVIELGAVIDETLNQQVIAMHHLLTRQPFTGMLDAIIAYSSLTVYYDTYCIRKQVDPAGSVFEWVQEQLIQVLQAAQKLDEESTLVRIPVCYEAPFASDLEKLAQQKNIQKEEVIARHAARTYRVYMIGFLPGFAYLASIDDLLVQPRKEKPAPVKAGSVGVAGLQTGIYPFDGPGGWHIIGRTPVTLFNPENEVPVLLKAGDRVEFYPISKFELEELNHRP